LDLVKVAKSFGFDAPPFVELPVSQKPVIKAREKYTGSGYQKKGPKRFKWCAVLMLLSLLLSAHKC
jgi:hypothetical protein